jgi:hypothetical protein
MLVIGAVVDQERLERAEEQPCRVVKAGGFGLAFAEAAPQLCQHHLRSRRAGARQQPALELADQQRPRPGLQIPQIGSQLFCRRGVLAGHGHRSRNSPTNVIVPAD